MSLKGPVKLRHSGDEILNLNLKIKEVISRRLKNSSPLYDHTIASYLITDHLYARLRSNLYFSEVHPYKAHISQSEISALDQSEAASDCTVLRATASVERHRCRLNILCLKLD
jgi:hypothetical protein